MQLGGGDGIATSAPVQWRNYRGGVPPVLAVPVDATGWFLAVCTWNRGMHRRNRAVRNRSTTKARTTRPSAYDW